MITRERINSIERNSDWQNVVWILGVLADHFQDHKFTTASEVIDDLRAHSKQVADAIFIDDLMGRAKSKKTQDSKVAMALKAMLHP